MRKLPRQEKKVLFNKIEVYETQINEREVKEDSLRSLILLKDIRIDSINNIVKINTPYNIIAPPEIKFLFLPMPYPDHYDW